MADLQAQRRKLLSLHYEDRIGADLFAEEEARLTRRIEAATAEADADQAETQQADDVARRFHDVAAALADLDVDRAWEAATDQERRVLLEEFLDSVTVLPDHLEVTVHGAPRLNVLLSEVGLKDSKNSGVGGGT